MLNPRNVIELLTGQSSISDFAQYLNKRVAMNTLAMSTISMLQFSTF